MTNVVVVESPSKAKTINKYLGQDYTVLASYGHVRDLPAKDGSVYPDDDFRMSWDLTPRSEKQIKEITRALKGATTLYLATDPDREGEAISWHVQQVLADRRALKGVTVKRVVFHSVTKDAVLEAMRNPRDLNTELVNAYLARRALDYLVGFTLSPVLWRKLPGARSAGRVQSVALRLICEREAEIELFRPQEYWTIEIDFTTPTGQPLTARLTQLDGKKLGKFDLGEKGAAEAAVARIESGPDFSVAEIERRRVQRRPQPPFTTSTLQQEASRKLGFSASRTMQLAQRLYEGIELDGETVGLITYMRTDSVVLAPEAIAASRALIERDYGERYLPAKPRQFSSTARNAQEAHEAVRPTDAARRPEDVSRYLDRDQQRLYELIWKRTLASQMENAQLDQVAIDIAAADRRAIARATGSVIAFDGFLRLYQEGKDDSEEDEGERRLPQVTEGDPMRRDAIRPDQHFTQPPPRFTEASLVKRLEELGIGRPSTYASIIQVLQDREYVRIEKRRFMPEDRGRLVTAFLAHFFDRYVQYGFTADLESQLDDISEGRIDWKEVLRRFWQDFSSAGGPEGQPSSMQQTVERLLADLGSVSDVISALDADLGPHFFPDRGDGRDPRGCPSCREGRLGLRLARTGAFIGCSRYPECRYTRPLEVTVGDGTEGGEDTGERRLGIDPETGKPVTLKRGPYGHYVQLGEAEGDSKPKRASLLRGMAPGDMDLDTALRLLALPRLLGRHPDSQEEVHAGVGRYGPYLKHGGTYVSLPAGEDVLGIGFNRAMEILANAPARPAPKALGDHPKDGAPITLARGRYGPYVRHGDMIASLAKGVEPDTLTLADAVTLLETKGKKLSGGGRRGAKAGSRTSARAATAKTPRPKAGAAETAGATATAAKKSPAKKSPAKKSSAAPRKTTAAKAPADATGTEAPPRKRRSAIG